MIRSRGRGALSQARDHFESRPPPLRPPRLGPPLVPDRPRNQVPLKRISVELVTEDVLIGFEPFPTELFYFAGPPVADRAPTRCRFTAMGATDELSALEHHPSNLTKSQTSVPLLSRDSSCVAKARIDLQFVRSFSAKMSKESPSADARFRVSWNSSAALGKDATLLYFRTPPGA
jgi:hypothetical protein